MIKKTSVAKPMVQLSAAALLLVVTGCGRGLNPVSGKVTLKDGTPMAGGQVLFDRLDPDSEDEKVSSRGVIQPDGSYRMGTLEDADGVREGKYRVLVIPALPRNPDRPPPGWPPINPRYGRYGETPLRFTVVRGDNKFDIPDLEK